MKEFSVILKRYQEKTRTIRYSAISEIDDGAGNKITVKGDLVSDLYISKDAFESEPPDQVIINSGFKMWGTWHGTFNRMTDGDVR
jgi:hypothetical protein